MGLPEPRVTFVTKVTDNIVIMYWSYLLSIHPGRDLHLLGNESYEDTDLFIG